LNRCGEQSRAATLRGRAHEAGIQRKHRLVKSNKRKEIGDESDGTDVEHEMRKKIKNNSWTRYTPENWDASEFNLKNRILR
jgi:hypothetical protein